MSQQQAARGAYHLPCQGLHIGARHDRSILTTACRTQASALRFLGGKKGSLPQHAMIDSRNGPQAVCRLHFGLSRRTMRNSTHHRALVTRNACPLAPSHTRIGPLLLVVEQRRQVWQSYPAWVIAHDARSAYTPKKCTRFCGGNICSERVQGFSTRHSSWPRAPSVQALP